MTERSVASSDDSRAPRGSKLGRLVWIGLAAIGVGIAAWFIFPYLGWRRKHAQHDEDSDGSGV